MKPGLPSVEKGEGSWKPWSHEAVPGTVESHGTAQTPSEGKELLTRADLDEELDGGNKITGENSAPEDQIISVCINLSKCNWR